MRFYIKLTLAFLKRFRIVILSSVILGALVFLFLSFILPNIKFTKTIRVGYTGRYNIDTLPLEISTLIGDGLVSIDSTSNINPSLAKYWSIEEGGKKWIFELQDNIFWQDKKPLKINEINYNFSDVDIQKQNNKIIFTLNEPYVPFIALLEKPVFKKGLLGTGEWKVNKLSIKGEYIQKLILSNKNERQDIKFYPTEEQTKFAFKIGEVDMIKNISSPKPFSDWNNVNIEKNIQSDRVVVIFFNTQDPILSDKNLRLALNYAIDKSGYEKRAIGPINPKSFYFNPQVKTYNFDPVKAKQLISESKAEIPQDYSINLISTPNLLDIADGVSKMWNDVGIKTNVLTSSVIPSDYQAFVTIFEIPKDPDQYSLWHSTQSQTNITKYKNVRIDKLLEDGRVELDKEKRKEIYFDFQRFLLEDSPSIFLFHPVWYNIARK